MYVCICMYIYVYIYIYVCIYIYIYTSCHSIVYHTLVTIVCCREPYPPSCFPRGSLAVANLSSYLSI